MSNAIGQDIIDEFNNNAVTVALMHYLQQRADLDLTPAILKRLPGSMSDLALTEQDKGALNEITSIREFVTNITTKQDPQ